MQVPNKLLSDGIGSDRTSCFEEPYSPGGVSVLIIEPQSLISLYWYKATDSSQLETFQWISGSADRNDSSWC